jgi:hypothetical protein
MSDKEIRVDTFGTTAPDLAKFGVGGSDLGTVKEALRQTDELRQSQNDALKNSGPVRRD